MERKNIDRKFLTDVISLVIIVIIGRFISEGTTPNIGGVDLMINFL